ncbi:MAG: glycosyltransferase family 39 protein [Chitinivibrionales bacterium]|nr:glycosyltransferase family 39 protein [Chitinivibrionales bacterium]
MKKNSLITFGIFLAIITAIHLFYAAYLGLGDDEAYYWEWGQHLDISYLDHPPMVAWLAAAGSALIGNSQLGARSGALLCSTLFVILLYVLSLRLFKDRFVALINAAIISIVPIFAAGSFMMVPDEPLSLFWMAALLCFYEIISSGQKNLWYALGLFLGLGLLSKYNMGALVLCVLAYLLFSKEDRHWLTKKEPYLALLIGAAIFAPVILWNARLGFPSFTYHLIERNRHGFSWGQMQLFIGGQFLYCSPFMFLAAIGAMIVTGIQGFKQKNRRSLFLFCMSAPYILAFTIPGCLSPTSKPHWTIMGYITAFMVLPPLIQSLWTNRKSWRLVIKITSIVSLGTSLCLTVALFAQSAYPIVKIKPNMDTTNELYGWPVAARAIDTAFHQMQMTAKTVIVTPRYNIAAQVAFYTPEHLGAYSLGGAHEQYGLWGRGSLDSLKGSNVLFVMDNRYQCDIDKQYVFQRIDTLPALFAYRPGRSDPVREFYLFKCYNLMGIKKI